MQWKCGLLQRLSDLTLEQNEEKSATLRSLLESESLLDAAEPPLAATACSGGGGGVGGFGSTSSEDGSYC